MKLLNILAALTMGLAPLVTAAILPEGTPDGFYLITFNDDGSQNITSIDLPAEPLPKLKEVRRNSGPHTKRDSFAGTGRMFPNHGHYNDCTNSWRSYLQLGGTTPARGILVASSGDARLAGCNYNYSAKWVYPQTVDQFNGALDGALGWWTTGWLHSTEYNFSFWRDLAGTAFCTNLP